MHESAPDPYICKIFLRMTPCVTFYCYLILLFLCSSSGPLYLVFCIYCCLLWSEVGKENLFLMASGWFPGFYDYSVQVIFSCGWHNSSKKKELPCIDFMKKFLSVMCLRTVIFILGTAICIEAYFLLPDYASSLIQPTLSKLDALFTLKCRPCQLPWPITFIWLFSFSLNLFICQSSMESYFIFKVLSWWAYLDPI